MNSVINAALDTFFPIRTEIKLTVLCPYCERSQLDMALLALSLFVLAICLIVSNGYRRR